MLGDEARQERLSSRLAGSALPALWSELERIEKVKPAGGEDTGEVIEAGQAPAAGPPLLSVDGRELLLGALSCPARLPLRLFQFTDLACISKLTLKEIRGLTTLELAMFSPLDLLKDLTVSGCPALKAVTLTRLTSGEGGAWCTLQQLDFSKNPLLASLPMQVLAEVPSVRELACADCPNLWSPPQEVAAQGGKECMDFARESLRDGTVSTRMTLFLLGDGEAGKTSVFRALKSAEGRAERIREDTRTVGIDTEDWTPEIEGAGEGTLAFRVLDLAGQAVYEMTHQFFLLQRAVYLLVWRAFPLAHDRRGVLTDRVRHWMQSLQLRVPGACVILAVTHIDSVDAAALDALCGVVRETVRACLDAMRRVAPAGGRVLSVLDGGESQRVNCLLGEGVAALRGRLVGFARTMPWYGELLPASFVRVREALERLVTEGRRHMLTAEWVRLCREHGMDGAMVAVGTRFLHETGGVRYFGNASTLTAGGGGDEVVYLSSKFMIAVMKGLVRHDRQALQDYFVSPTGRDKLMLRRTNRLNATGRLHEALLPFLWPEVEASRAYWAWVRGQGQREAELWPKDEDVVADEGDVERAVGLLKGFDLVVQLEGNDELLVPGALPPARTQLSADAFAPEAALPFAASHAYPALPPGMFQRIVVRVAGQVDWADFGADRAVFFLLGNLATLAMVEAGPGPGQAPATPPVGGGGDAGPSGRTVLRWRASGRALRGLITKAVEDIEGFFPGLPRLEKEEDAPASAREPAQVLVLAATDETAALVRKALEAAAKAKGMEGLVVEVRVPGATGLAEAELGRVRVLLACMAEASAAAEAEVEAHVRAGHARVIPVLLAGFEAALPQLLDQAPPADLRACSATRARMEAAVRRQAEEEEEERARLEREGRSVQPAMSVKDMDAWVNRETGERLAKQDREAADAAQRELLPRITKLLREWRVAATEVASQGAATGPGHDAVQCGGGGGGGTGCGHAFSRKALEAAQANAADDAREICPLCKAVHRVRDLLASPEVRPCPACLRKGAAGAAGGFFSARECRLRMGEGLSQRSYTAQCRACGEHVRLFEVFPPEVFASLHTPPGGLSVLVEELIRAIEAEADVLVWPARRETQRGGGPDAESRRALALAPVVLLLVTEDYAASLECAAEASEAAKAGKLVVPVLLPGLARDAAQAPPAQDAGPAEAEAFWEQLAAHRRDRLRLCDALGWTLLGDCTPLVVPEAADCGQGAASRLNDVACVAAARIASRLHRAVKVDVFSDLSRFGVRLSYFNFFIREQKEGRKAFANLTTFQMMERFVKPRTASSQLSLCEQLMSDGGDGAAYVATAKIFLSHAWKYLFLDVVDATERRFSGSADPDPVVWFDVFSVSQHKSSERDFAWWNSTFLNAVGSMGEVVMVLQPWRTPVPLTRVWCIFEAYAAEATSSRFSVAMTDSEARDLVETICNNPSVLLAALRRVCCEASTATQVADRDSIFDTVRQSVGFAHLNGMVAARMLEAVCDELFRRQAQEGLAEKARLLLVLAQLRGLQRSDAEAERLHRECLAGAAPSPGISMRAGLGIAAACARQGKGGDAIEAYRSVLRAASDLPPGDRFRQEASSGLALEYAAVPELLPEAESLAAEWAAVRSLEKCGAALRNFGMLRLAQGAAADGEGLLRAGVDALREQAGEWSPLLPWHPDTLEAMAGVAAAAEAQGRFAEAEEGLRGLLAQHERHSAAPTAVGPTAVRTLGAEHDLTLKTRDRILALQKQSLDAEHLALKTRDLPASPGIANASRPVGPGSPAERGAGSRHLANVLASVTSGQTRAQAAGAPHGGGDGGTGSRAAWEVLEGLWEDLRDLHALEELQLREVLGLDRITCRRLASMALKATSLRSLDLR
jgi:hypothetical protein